MRGEFGVLALQGDFAAHEAALRRAGVPNDEVRAVRRVGELSGLKGLVLPGGESTALLKLMADEDWFAALRGFHAQGGALFGTCAGAILLAREVSGPRQPSLGLLEATVDRNAYGRQVDSFEAEIDAPRLGGPISGVFIRAPRFVATGPGVEILGRLEDAAVLVRQGRVLASTFHPEIAGDDRLHRLFIGLAA
jgi:5'-phosphate synthase pdxT subunit